MENNASLLIKDPADQANTIQQPWLRILRFTWIVLAILAIIILIAAIPGYIILLEARSRIIETTAVSSIWIDILKISIIAASVATTSLSLFLSWIIFRQKSGERMPAYLSFFLVLYGIAVAGPLEAIYPFFPRLSNLEFGLIIASLLGPAFVALFVIFPDGQFVPSWTRWLIALSISIVPVSYYLEASLFTVIDNPLFWVGAGIAVGTLLMVIYAQTYRYRNVSGRTERQQTKWVIYGILLWFLVMAISSVPYAQVQQLPPGSFIPWWHLLNELVYLISLSFLPLSLTLAVLRYRLFDIDIIINRTLVYGILTATTMGLYVFIVGYLGSLFQTINQTTLAFLATGLVAIVFQPLRERLQKVINRFMFGERDDPLGVLSSLSKRLEGATEPEAVLPNIVNTVGQALKLPYVAIEVFNGTVINITAVYGERRDSTEYIPLIHQTERIGQLAFARRSPHERFSEAEYKLLGNIARQTGTAVHAAKLTSDLRRSRQQLITAREEERRRLRRDLHDGLGPTLASLTLKIDTARNQLKDDPNSADRLLVETKEQIQDTLRDIRNLVYALRPPALDELGLIRAVRAYVDQQNVAGLKITVAETAEYPNLPAAVEVAAYRIALEGVTNIIRHAQASEATISIFPENGTLIVEIVDNGIGLPEPVPVGIGMTSMKERSEELSGKLVLVPQEIGTRLRACLPVARK